MSDTIFPSVFFNSPTQGQTVSGTHTVSVTVSDNVAINTTQLHVNPYVSGGATVEKSWANESDYETAYFINPYTGLVYSYGFTETLSASVLAPLRNGITNSTVSTPGVGVSCLRWYINPTRFKYSDFDDAYLQGIRNSFQAVRNAGMSVFPTMSYVFTPGTGGAEPTMTQWKRHIDDLAQIYNEFSDVIYLLKGGGSGGWDEEQTWDGVNYFEGLSSHSALTEKRDYVRGRINNKHIANRSLRNIYTGAASLVGNTGWMNDAALATAANAYGEGSSSNNTWQQAIHIDSWGVDGFSGGDYGVENGTKVPFNVETINPSAAAAQEAFLRNLNRWSPHYVEGGNADQFLDGSGFTRRQLINMAIDRSQSHVNYYAFSKPDAFLGGNSNADAIEWRRTIGYRLWLKRLRVTVSSNILVEMDWHNKGSAGVHHLARAFIEFTNGTNTVQVKLSDSIRRTNTPRGQGTNTVTFVVSRPVSLVPGSYAIRLWFPGEGHTDPKYAIRVATRGITFNSAGRNDPAMNITVT
jgi:hypothetical protein